MKKGGTAKFTNFKSFRDWYMSIKADELDSLEKTLESALDKYYPNDTRKRKEDRAVPQFVPILQNLYNIHSGYFENIGGGVPYEKTKAGRWEAERVENAKIFDRYDMMSTEYEQPMNVLLWTDEFAIVYFGNPDKGILIPEPDKYMEYIPEKDYSDMTTAELRARLGAGKYEGETDIIPVSAQGVMTQKDVGDKLEGKETELEQLKKQIENTKKGTTEELAPLKAEIDKLTQQLETKKRDILATLDAKVEEANAMMERLRGQLYMLESQIYAIRCYAGETVAFAKIRSGKNAPDNEPIIIHQKLRFLDEDLGRITSLYSIEWSGIEMFEQFLAHHPLALETFAPNERCISLVRISRTNKQIGADDMSPFQNVLKDYEYFHGRTIGIIIRNGENLYLGWTDEDKIDIKDDLIISQVLTEPDGDSKTTELSTFTSDEARKKGEKAKQEEYMRGVISRTFVYNILQGVVDNTPLLPLPKGETLGKQSKYVVYAVADKWLADTRFGSFTDIVERCNKKVDEGDMLLVTQFLVPERPYSYTRGYYSSTWCNTRGRGDKNRTHDCSVEDCKIYPANLVEYDEPIDMIRFVYYSYDPYHPEKPLERSRIISEPWEKAKDLIKGAKKGTAPDGKEWFVVAERNTVTGEYEAVKDKDGQPLSIRYLNAAAYEIIEHYERRDRHVYVSVEKDTSRYSWRYGEEGYKPARSNFELYQERGEFISLTYMNSVWLTWVINNKNLGGWKIAGTKVDYAYAIRYLNTAMDFVREREKQEKIFIDEINPSITEKDAEWSLKLSEFKLEKNVRNITAYQAKRFAKWYIDFTKQAKKTKG